MRGSSSAMPAPRLSPWRTRCPVSTRSISTCRSASSGIGARRFGPLRPQAGWMKPVSCATTRMVFPLRELLCAGRIAGQQRRPDRGNGSWWFRCLAESRDAMAIQRAPATDSPVSAHRPEHLSRRLAAIRGPPGLLGGTGVAAFGYLKSELTSACHALTAPPADCGNLQPDHIEAHLKWYAKVEGSGNAL